MLRTLSISFLALLLMVTLVWGGCVSCPQFFMIAGGDESCCRPTGECGKKSGE
ncbi:MAG: hypothetical protein ACRD7E_11045 [Bryobacteraceae bacterium]